MLSYCYVMQNYYLAVIAGQVTSLEPFTIVDYYG